MQPEDLLSRIIHGADDPPRPVRRRKEADPPPVQHWTHPVLLERCAWLKRMARAGEGWAADVLRDNPGHRTTLVVRLRNSQPETLDAIYQIVFVLEGRATLVTSGATQELRPGDVIHIAPNIPVQFLVPNEKPFSTLILHIPEPAPEN